VPAVLAEWGEYGARGAVVLASGFGESGEAGGRIEAEIVAVARRTGIRVVGPNTSGVLNVPIGMNLIGLDGVTPGPLAVLVQSGNMALALVTEAARAGTGFSFVIGVGNEADIAFDEYLDFLAGDSGTGGILVHAEGFRDGRSFLSAAARASRIKPVIVLKGGRTERGGNAARSHTGAVAGSYDVFRAGLRQAGVIEIQRSDELLPVLITLVQQPPVRPTRGVVVLSDGGGQATIAADDLHARDIPVAGLSTGTEERLRALLGPAAAVSNPVDLAGAADRDPLVFAHALEIIAEDAAAACVLVVGLFGGYAIRFAESLLAGEVEAATQMPEIARDAGIPLILHTLYAGTNSEPIRILRRAGIPVVESLEIACRCTAASVERDQATARLRSIPADWPAADSGVDESRHGDAFNEARREDRTLLLEPEARALLEQFGVPLVPAAFCRTAADAAEAARSFDGNVAVRIVTPAAPHKTDAGGVALNVRADEVERITERVFESVRSWAAARNVSADIRGVLVSPMLARPAAELIVGVRRDPQFGPVLTVGAGGTDVEWLRDVATRVLPVSADDVGEMLEGLRMAPVLRGYRGTRGVARDALVDGILGIASCALAHPAITEMEVNPLFAYADRVVAVDVRIFIS
jgi:acetyltransferase